MPRVLLADDHRIVRSALAVVLENLPAIEVVGQAANGEAAIEFALAPARRHHHRWD